MRRRVSVMLMSIVCLALAACGGGAAQVVPTPTPSAAQQLLAKVHLHDASFTITFTTESAHGTGTGTLTTQPAFVHLLLGGGQEMLIDTPDDLLYGRLNGDKLWSMLNDADNGIYANYDTAAWNLSQLHNPQIIGSETVDGVAAWHVRAAFTAPMVDTSGNAVPVPGTEDVWVRASDDLPLRLTKHATFTGTGSNGTALSLSLMADYHFTRWNTGVTITMPDPEQVAASG